MLPWRLRLTKFFERKDGRVRLKVIASVEAETSHAGEVAEVEGLRLKVIASVEAETIKAEKPDGTLAKLRLKVIASVEAETVPGRLLD